MSFMEIAVVNFGVMTLTLHSCVFTFSARLKLTNLFNKGSTLYMYHLGQYFRLM